MLFNSVIFLIFLTGIVILYWILPHKFRWVALLIASYYFYMSWNVELVILISGTTLISYLTTLVIGKSEHQALRRTMLIINIVSALGVLFFFKYFNFFSGAVTDFVRLFGIPMNAFALNLILPVGVSFYTFQTLSYSIDVYKGKYQAECHLGYYALYVSFFPQLVAGPIERPDSLLPQLKEKRMFDIDNFRSGLHFIVVGFFKKLVIADFIAAFVNNIFNNPTEAGGFSVLVAAALFSVQILCDFDGYTNIAIGCGKLMNVNMTKNFDNPYGATSIKLFWSKWHMTLSKWFRDYLYIPLGGNRVKKSRWCFNVFFVFLVSGLWHGANYTFLIWGALHGIYQIIEHFLEKPAGRVYDKLKINQKGKGFQYYRVLRTFILVTFAWIFFRAGTVGDAFTLIGKLFGDWSFSINYFTLEFTKLGMTTADLIISVLGIVTLYCLAKHDSFFEPKAIPIPLSGSLRALKAQHATRFALNVLVVTAIAIAWVYVLYLSGGENSFIYFQF